MRLEQINKPIKEYRNVVTPRDEAHYRELMKTLQDLELKSARDPETMAEIKRRKMELRNWAEQNLKTEGGQSDMPQGQIGDLVRVRREGDKHDGELGRIVDYSTDEDKKFYTLKFDQDEEDETVYGAGEDDFEMSELDFLDQTVDRRDWAEPTEGFIGKKPEYTDFLQNKLDQAIQEYDSPEKKAQRDALMKQYLAKGGSVEKVPAGVKAYKGKELKPAFKKDKAGTPVSSPMSDESAVKESPIEQDHNNPIAKPYVNMPEWKALHDMDDKIVQAYIKHKEVKEEAPFDGRGILQRAVFNKWISAEEWFHLKDEWKAASQELEQRYDDWPEGQGFGTSDHNYAIKELMGLVGYEFDEQDTSGKFVVTKMPDELEKKGIKNVRMKGEPVATEAEQNEDTEATLLGKAEASLMHGLEMAQTVLKKDYGMAEQVASVIRQNWPALIDKIKNIYKTEDDSEVANGLQPVDLKRLGQTEPKVYVHKDGKTILIPKRKHNEYLAKGWKQSSLRAETESYDSKLTAMLEQRLK